MVAVANQPKICCADDSAIGKAAFLTSRGQHAASQMRLRAQRGRQHSSARNIGRHMLRATYGDEALVRSDGPRRHGGLVLLWVVRGRPTCFGQQIRSRHRCRCRQETSDAARCRAKFWLRRDRTASARQTNPPKEMPCRRTGRLGALILRPPSRVCSGRSAARSAVNSRANVGGRRMLRPDVADISRPRLTE
jgi:hypothetical protein